MYCISRRQYQRFLNILFLGCLSGAVDSVDVSCSAKRSCHGRGRGKIFTACIYSIVEIIPSKIVHIHSEPNMYIPYDNILCMFVCLCVLRNALCFDYCVFFNLILKL